MDVGISQSLQRLTMERRAVPFMFSKPIAGILQIELAHQCVTPRLRQHGSRRDAQALHIAFDERHLWNIQFGKLQTKISQKKIWNDG